MYTPRPQANIKISNTPQTIYQDTTDLCWHMLLVFGAFIATNLFPGIALASAGSDNAITDVFNQIIDLIVGGTGKAISAIAVIALGISALFGKLSWERAVLLAVGIAIVYGGASIIYTIAGRGEAGLTGGVTVPGAATDDSQAGLNILYSFIQLGGGYAGLSIASIALIALGISAYFGKISWPIAVTVGVGIAAIFGAFSIIHAVKDGDANLQWLIGGAKFNTLIGGTNAGRTASGTAVSQLLIEAVNRGINNWLQPFAALAIILLGFAALFGKVSFQTATVVFVGIAIAIGAAQIVALFLTGFSMGNADLAGTLAYNNKLSSSLVVIANELTGPIAAAICTLGVIIFGCAAMLGKVSYQTAFTIAIGFFFVFGAYKLVAAWISTFGINVADMSFATNHGGSRDSIVYTIFGRVYSELSGPTGRALAAILVAAIGIGAFLGKISLASVILVYGGIAVFFGAGVIVTQLAGDGNAVTAPNGFQHGICEVEHLLFGANARFVATFGIMGLGVMAMMGKISYQAALTVVAGIAFIFGANTFLNIMAPNNLTMIGATANGGDPIAGILCGIANLLTGATGRAVATIAMASIGLGAMFGKINFNAAMIIIVGIGIMFGAQTLATQVFGFNAPCVTTAATQNC